MYAVVLDDAPLNNLLMTEEIQRLRGASRWRSQRRTSAFAFLAADTGGPGYAADCERRVPTAAE
jgi:hypothetical protein